MRREFELRPGKQADALEKVLGAYSIHPEFDMRVFEAAAREVGELREEAESDLGLNRTTLELAREGRIKALESEGALVDEDPLILLIDQQLVFNQRMGGHVVGLSDYRQRLEVARQRENAETQSKYPVYDEPPERHFTHRQHERYLRANELITQTTEDFMDDTGIRPYRILTKFYPRGVKTNFKIQHWHEGDDPDQINWKSPDKELTLSYEPGNRVVSDSLWVHHSLSLLVPKRKATKIDIITIDQAYAYFQSDEGDTSVSPHIKIKEITPDNMKKLLTMAAASKGWGSSRQLPQELPSGQ